MGVANYKPNRAVAAVVAIFSSPCVAQRATENATVQASDAFGFTIGTESIGIYDRTNARGINPTAAGNVRVDGLYFDQVAPLTDHALRSVTIRVGLTSLEAVQPAPSGLVDEALRVPDRTVFSTTIGVGDYLAPYMSVDGGLVTKSGAIAVGYGGRVVSNKYETGGSSRSADASVLLSYRPRSGIQLVAFGESVWNFREEDRVTYYSAGQYLPPAVPRRTQFNQPWASSTSNGNNLGLIASARLADITTATLAVFRSRAVPGSRYNEEFVDIDRSGRAEDVLTVQNDRTFVRSYSGEFRLAQVRRSARGRSEIVFNLRARRSTQLFGGDFSTSLGVQQVGIFAAKPEVSPVFTDSTKSNVAQSSAGLSFLLERKRLGELRLGAQETILAKTVGAPSGAYLPRTEERSDTRRFLYNAAFAVPLAHFLTLFSTYAKGLEEGGVAPQRSKNRGEILSGVLTTQADVGLRTALPRDTVLTGAVFSIARPYAGVGATDGLYQYIGAQSIRGLEFSLRSAPTRNLRLLIGALLLNNHRDLAGQQSLTPIGTIKRTLRLNADYGIPGLRGASAALSVVNFHGFVASSDGKLLIPDRTVVNASLRYQFALLGARHTAKLYVNNVTNVFGWNVYSDGGYLYNAPRRIGASLITDW